MTYTDGYPYEQWTDDDPDLAMPPPTLRYQAIDVEAKDVTNFLPAPTVEEKADEPERVRFNRAAFVRAVSVVALLLGVVGTAELPHVVSTGKPDVVVMRSAP